MKRFIGNIVMLFFIVNLIGCDSSTYIPPVTPTPRPTEITGGIESDIGEGVTSSSGIEVLSSVMQDAQSDNLSSDLNQSLDLNQIRKTGLDKLSEEEKEVLPYFNDGWTVFPSVTALEFYYMGQYIDSFNYGEIGWSRNPYEVRPPTFLNDKAYLFNGDGYLIELDLLNHGIRNVLRPGSISKYGDWINWILPENGSLRTLSFASEWTNLLEINVELGEVSLAGRSNITQEDSKKLFFLAPFILTYANITILPNGNFQNVSGSSHDSRRTIYEFNLENGIVQQKEIVFDELNEKYSERPGWWNIDILYVPYTNKAYTYETFLKQNEITGFDERYMRVIEYDVETSTYREICEIKGMKNFGDSANVYFAGENLYFMQQFKKTDRNGELTQPVSNNCLIICNVVDGSVSVMPVGNLHWKRYKVDLFNIYTDRVIPIDSNFRPISTFYKDINFDL